MNNKDIREKRELELADKYYAEAYNDWYNTAKNRLTLIWILLWLTIVCVSHFAINLLSQYYNG